MLMLAALGAGREVIVSRGELVEIGGGFRVPDVMAQSGAILREVGTTNRTRAADYAAAISDRTALILRVHPSNFTIEGFTERPTIGELVALGRRLDVPVVEDLGSGNLIGGMVAAAGGAGAALAGLSWLQPFLRDEPTVQQSVAAGVDVLCVSGDKLLGGPQAGLIARAPRAGRTDPPPSAHAGAARRQDDLRGAGRHAGRLRFGNGRGDHSRAADAGANARTASRPARAGLPRALPPLARINARSSTAARPSAAAPRPASPCRRACSRSSTATSRRTHSRARSGVSRFRSSPVSTTTASSWTSARSSRKTTRPWPQGSRRSTSRARRTTATLAFQGRATEPRGLAC